MSNSHVRSAKAIAGAVAYFCQVLVIGDGGSLTLGRLVSHVCWLLPFPGQEVKGGGPGALLFDDKAALLEQRAPADRILRWMMSDGR